MKRNLAVLLFLCILVIGASGQFEYRLVDPIAMESFRTGVESYNRGRYAESLLLFEKTVQLYPQDPLSLYWLGKAYYRLGMLSSAKARWNEAQLASGSSPFLESRIEQASSVLDRTGKTYPDNYIKVKTLEGIYGKESIFLRPSWIEPLQDGSHWLVSHGTNQILKIDSNGQIRERITGGTGGFDRPFAMTILPDGKYFVSDFQSNRIFIMDNRGSLLKVIDGNSGPERLAGPQFICSDPDGFVYITDVGFSRVVKYNDEGSFVMTFGQKTPAFSGLKLPTGIAWHQGRVYVADSIYKCIFVFDPYGNYLGSLADGLLVRPEGIRSTENGLLLADTSRILLLDPETEALTVLYKDEKQNARILSAAFDANGDLLAPDFDHSELSYLADATVRYSGLFVEILNVNSDRWPSVTMDLSVKDRFGNPLVGLGESNFYISETFRKMERRVEGGKTVDYFTDYILPASSQKFLGRLADSNECDVCIMVEASPFLSARRLEIRDLLEPLVLSFPDASQFSILAASAIPQPAVSGNLTVLSRALLAMNGEQNWRLDAGVRLAAGQLFASSGRKSIIFIGSGQVNENLLQSYSLAELADLLLANNIVFNVILLGQDELSPVLDYLTQLSGGQIIRSTDPLGPGVLAKNLLASPSGIYRLSFTSQSDDGFGHNYLPFSVEVYLRDRSGKDSGASFAPLR